uniref:Uncharacterized protein n=1 Tax=Arundo donax TaxID=35708 RepID=A0A0A8Z106_ARUDO
MNPSWNRISYQGLHNPKKVCFFLAACCSAFKLSYAHHHFRPRLLLK